MALDKRHLISISLFMVSGYLGNLRNYRIWIRVVLCRASNSGHRVKNLLVPILHLTKAGVLGYLKAHGQSQLRAVSEKVHEFIQSGRVGTAPCCQMKEPPQDQIGTTMFYADAIVCEKLDSSITGQQYAHGMHGPVIDGILATLHCAHQNTQQQPL